MSGTVGRRAFLILSTAYGSMVLSRSARAADIANQRIVIGIMGLSRGRDLAQVFLAQPGVAVKYVCDTDKERAAAGAKLVVDLKQKEPQAIQDFRRILDDKEVDLLVCAAPNHWHAPATILACKAGKHVYVEKPCCHNPHEGELMVQAARQYKRAVQMGSQRRSGPGTQDAMRRLREGIIGRVYLARSWYNAQRPSLGKGTPSDPPPRLDYDLWQGPAPRRPYQSNLIHYNWHWRWHWGNGELGNNGVHVLDLCRWGLGVDFPTRVTSSGGRYCYDDDQETPDTHAVCFEFPEKRAASWEGLSCSKHGNGFVTFYGENGTLELESNGRHTVYDAGDKKKDTFASSSLGDKEHVVNLLDAIRNDKPLELNAEIEIGHRSTLLCHLGNIAHRTGRALRCDPSNGHILDDAEAMALWRREYQKGWEPTV